MGTYSRKPSWKKSLRLNSLKKKLRIGGGKNQSKISDDVAKVFAKSSEHRKRVDDVIAKKGLNEIEAEKYVSDQERLEEGHGEKGKKPVGKRIKHKIKKIFKGVVSDISSLHKSRKGKAPGVKRRKREKKQSELEAQRRLFVRRSVPQMLMAGEPQTASKTPSPKMSKKLVKQGEKRQKETLKVLNKFEKKKERAEAKKKNKMEQREEKLNVKAKKAELKFKRKALKKELKNEKKQQKIDKKKWNKSKKEIDKFSKSTGKSVSLNIEEQQKLGGIMENVNREREEVDAMHKYTKNEIGRAKNKIKKGKKVPQKTEGHQVLSDLMRDIQRRREERNQGH